MFSPNAVQYAKEALKKRRLHCNRHPNGKVRNQQSCTGKTWRRRIFVLCPMKMLQNTAKQQGTTRAVASMDKAVALNRPTIFAIGNAPTALIRLYELDTAGVTA